MKEEALALADYLDNNVEAMLFTEQPHLDKASAMIRRLVAELSCANDYIKQYQFEIKNHKYDPETGEPLIDGYPLFSGLPRGKPLSDEEIMEVAKKKGLSGDLGFFVNFARAILERQGIK